MTDFRPLVLALQSIAYIKNLIHKEKYWKFLEWKNLKTLPKFKTSEENLRYIIYDIFWSSSISIVMLLWR